MAFEDVLQFWQRVQTDTDFQKSLRSVSEQPEEDKPGAVAAIAQQAGFSVTADEFNAMESALAFVERVEHDTELRAKLQPAGELESEEEALSAVVQVAEGEGYEFPSEVLAIVTKALAKAGADAEHESSRLSDAQLEAVTGGAGSAYPSSFQTALGGGLVSDRQGSLGPGFMATYIQSPG